MSSQGQLCICEIIESDHCWRITRQNCKWKRRRGEGEERRERRYKTERDVHVHTVPSKASGLTICGSSGVVLVVPLSYGGNRNEVL